MFVNNPGKQADSHRRVRSLTVAARLLSRVLTVAAPISMTQNYKAVIQYDGTEYYGWQIQRNHPTIQAEVQKAIHRITSERTVVIGSGRTDSGVHAEGQVASFVLHRDYDCSKLLKALNALLPESIRVVRLSTLSPKFHAQFSALEKIYWYRIWNAPVAHPLWRRFALHVPQSLNIERMNLAARHLEGRHNFRAFAAASATSETFEREVQLSRFTRRERMLIYKVAANGFLHHMVRNIVGTILLVGKGKLPPTSIREILRSQDRNQAGPTAPPHGLTLKRVVY